MVASYGILQVAGCQPSIMLLEDIWLLGRHHVFVVICPCPRLINPHTYLTVRSSSSSSASSSMAYDPILLLGSFIPTKPTNPTTTLSIFKYMFKSLKNTLKKRLGINLQLLKQKILSISLSQSFFYISILKQNPTIQHTHDDYLLIEFKFLNPLSKQKKRNFIYKNKLK